MNPLSTSSPSVVRPLGPEELAVARPRPRIIDVRESSEFTGELGHIPGAELVPLATVEGAARGWARDEPLVVVCRSGARSARAAATLVQLGFKTVFNLEGGTQGHVSAGLAVERR